MKGEKIVIIDYGAGNMGAVLNIVKKVGAIAVISSEVSDIEKADKLILPGVGTFDTGMLNLKKSGLLSILNKKVLQDKIPILGICLGFQLLGKKSEEGKEKGLGWIDAKSIKFNRDLFSERLKIPHMGWNNIDIKKRNALLQNTSEQLRFYFVHSYHMVCNNKSDILAQTFYGYDFVSAINQGNIYGTQFHPEKSHKFGIETINNFVNNI